MTESPTSPASPSSPSNPARQRRPDGLLGQRNFRLLWIGETVSEAGNSMAVVGVPLVAVLVLHASTFAVAALTAAAYLPWLVIGLPAGAWLGVLSTAQVVAVALLAGAANVFFATAYQVYLPFLVTEAELVAGNARLQGGASVASIVGRASAGVAAQAVGAVAALLFNAASFGVSAVCLLRIRPAPSPQPPRPADGVRAGGVRAETWQGVCFVARDPYLRPLTIYAAVANLAYTGNLALVVVFLVRVVGLSSAAVGLLMATGGIGGLCGALVAPRLTRAFGTARTLVVTSLGARLSGLFIPLTERGPGSPAT